MALRKEKLSRKERERLFKRQEIVNAACTVFAVHGFTAATLDEIAEKAEFGKGTLYNYFQSKEELFETVIADVLDEILEIAIDTCLVPNRTLRKSYLDFARQLFYHFFNNAGMYSLLARELHRIHYHPHMAVVLPNLLLILREPLQRAVASGEISPLPLSEAQTSFVFLSTVFSVFKSIVHVHFQQMDFKRFHEMNFTAAEVDEYIAQGIALVNRTYFIGVLSHSDEDVKQHDT